MKSRKKLGERRRGGWKCVGGSRRKGEGEGEKEEEGRGRKRKRKKGEGGGKKWEGGKRGGKV